MFWTVLYGLKENLFRRSLCTGAICEMQQLSSVAVPGGWCMEIWSLIVYVCVSLFLSLPFSLCILMIKRAQTSSRWAYSHPRILWWGSRFGWGRSRRPYQKPGEQQQQQQKNLSCTKGLLRGRRSSHLKRRPLHLFSLFVVIPHNWSSNCIPSFFFSSVRNWIEIQKTKKTKQKNIQGFLNATLLFLALMYRHCIYCMLICRIT